ncbi:MAG: ABC transporter ATP-binding protein, partial [Bdellovibrionales bacterium]
IMIDVRSAFKKFGRNEVLRGVDLLAKSSCVTGILGPNGCGKTTLIKSILGLVVPDAGEIRIANEVIKGQYEYRRKIGYMPQNAQFPSHLKIFELFEMLEDIRQQKGSMLDELINKFELADHMNKSFDQLSGGTRQKVAAVTAFMFEPDILILDEPTVGLDPVAVVKLKDLIVAAAKKGRTVLLVTHMVAEIEHMVQEMIFILDGRVQFKGTLSEIRKLAQVDNLETAIVKLLENKATKTDLNLQNKKGDQ